MFVRRSGRLNPGHNAYPPLESMRRPVNPEPVNSSQEKRFNEAPPQVSQQQRYFNSPHIEKLVEEMKQSCQQRNEPEERIPDSDSPDKKVSATTKALEARESEEFDKKRLKKVKTSTAVRRKKLNQQLSRLLTPKSALILLHELKPSCVINVQLQPGCIPPSFCAQVECENTVLGTGVGVSKAQAKNAAAENAIKTMVSRTLSKSCSNLSACSEGEEVNVDDDDEDTPENLPWAGIASFALYKMFSEWKSQGADLLSITRPVPKPKAKVQQVNGAPKKELPPNAAELHPGTVLNMMHQGLTAVELEREDPPNCRVKMAYTIDGKMFTGIGRNKKDAKREAAKAVLESLHGLTYPS